MISPKLDDKSRAAVGELLRAGDPAADDPGAAIVDGDGERMRIRHSMLAEAHRQQTPQRPWRLLLAAVMTGLVAILVALPWLRRVDPGGLGAGEPGTTQGRATAPVVATAEVSENAADGIEPTTVPPPESGPVADQVQVAALEADQAPVAPPRPVPTARNQRDAGGGTNQATSSSSNKERRQLQFETPGGTRLIWVFDPNLTL